MCHPQSLKPLITFTNSGHDADQLEYAASWFLNLLDSVLFRSCSVYGPFSLATIAETHRESRCASFDQLKQSNVHMLGLS